jgi:short subunit dehydrogenase-like uncharacterized protein
LQTVPFIIADANDKSSLTNLAAKTDVIIAVAGPYAKYGTNVVEASLEQGTHYCDITGQWQAEMCCGSSWYSLWSTADTPAHLPDFLFL